MTHDHSQMAAGQEWAAMIRSGAGSGDASAIIDAINRMTAARQAYRGAVMLACAQVLAQSIVEAGPDRAPGIRSGIMALIDGFATQAAIGDGRE
jgi:hypothetical protein